MQAFGRCRCFRLYTLLWSCYFSKTGLVPSYWTLTDMRQTPKEILGTNFCLSKSFTNDRQNLVRILFGNTHLFPYSFPDDHALFLFHLSNAWKRFQWSANSLLEELHVAKMRTSKSEEINIVSAWCQILLFWRCCNAWAMSSANVYNANSVVIQEFVTTSKSACDRFSLASF